MKLSDKDMQIDIFGGETEHQEVAQTMICTRDDLCKAPVDAHDPDCPVEWMLREELGF